MSAVDKRIFRTNNIDIIKDIISVLSDDLSKNIKDGEYEYTLFYKDIKHADITSCGKHRPPTHKMVKGKKVKIKRSKIQYEKNLLNYYTVEEMKKLHGHFPTNHQSNIYVQPLIDAIGAGDLLRRNVDLKNYATFYIVNSTLKYFTYEYTKLTISNLNKDPRNCINEYDINSEWCTLMHMTKGPHGLGAKEDVLFQKIRMNIFLYDRIYFLLETKDNIKNVFVLLEKNPKFYTITNLKNESWAKYLHDYKQKIDNLIDSKEPIDKSDSRGPQARWKEQLAFEMMSYINEQDIVKCPFTDIRASFNDMKTLFRASHIVSFKDSNSIQKYDLNNGLLLCANADALFDKHLISVNPETRKIECSFLFKNKSELRDNLSLLRKSLTDIIFNEQRLKYISKHYEIFKRLEKERTEIEHKVDNEQIEELEILS